MTIRIASRKTSVLPPELLGAVPRDVRLTAGGMAVAVAAVALIAAALVTAILLTLVSNWSADTYEARRREGVTVAAEVLQVERPRGENPRTVTYRYEADGHSYSGRTRLRQQDRRSVSPGGVIAVEYLRSKPETSWLAGAPLSRFPLAVIPLVVCALLVIPAILVRSIRRQWILLSEGRAAEAHVTAVSKRKGESGSTYRLSYEFHTLSGARTVSRSEVAKAPPSIGATIPVVYHRDRPEWSAVYPLKLVRPGRLVQ